MNKLKIIFTLLVVVSILIVSCEGDCKDEKITKAEWVVQYEDYTVEVDTLEKVTITVDTLVAYSVIEHKVEKDSKSEAVHYITIANNNLTYANDFAIKFVGKEYNESTKSWKDINKTTNYYTIYPQRRYTFNIRHKAYWHNTSMNYDENNFSMFILQCSKRVSKTELKTKKIKKQLQRRIDKLVLTDTILNSCRTNIEGMRMKYDAIQEEYKAKVLPKDQIINDLSKN